ncbi:MAG: hypothetical protein WC444_05845 [Candidatus Paceibacterota bacterium]
MKRATKCQGICEDKSCKYCLSNKCCFGGFNIDLPCYAKDSKPADRLYGFLDGNVTAAVLASNPKFGEQYKRALVREIAQVGPYLWTAQIASCTDERNEEVLMPPSGEWYNVPYGDHRIFINSYIEYTNPDTEERNDTDYLMKRGWIVIRRICEHTILTLDGRMNPTQYAVLKKHFKDTKFSINQQLKTLDEIYSEQ